MNLTDLKGVGEKTESRLNRLNIYTLEDLCNYYPYEYEDRRTKGIFANKYLAKKCTFYLKICSTPRINYKSKVTLTSIDVFDGHTYGKIIWFNDKFSPMKLYKDKEYYFYGKLFYSNGYELINPIFSETVMDEIVPKYYLTEGISNKLLRKIILQAIKFFDFKNEFLPDEIYENFGLYNRKHSTKVIHFPKNLDSLNIAKKSVKIFDLLKEICILNSIKENNESINSPIIKNIDLDIIFSKIDFKLTKSQIDVIEEIIFDLKNKNPMNRLLNGDVGSGKTIVSIIAMIICNQNGYQAAMMVPTELLAIQQFEKYKDLIESLGFSVSLLIGSTKDKVNVKKRLSSGEIDILIGTHALLQDDVKFKNLALVVNDEQHRFGVLQRKKLALKNKGVNVLTMTATPIPRTLSIKLNKLLDISILKDKPDNRKPVVTKSFNINSELKLFDLIRKNCRKKNQVYVVTSSINNDEDKNNVELLYKRFIKYFKDLKIEKVHGRMNSNEKDHIFKNFLEGKSDILISTTVIEVGVDVKNANMILIYNANRFGLSTLHQLRGRVGRGEKQSYCFLISENESDKKLKIMENISDGYEIAKKDLELRGGGNIFSTFQSGKNMDIINSLKISRDEIDLAFEIFEFCKKNNIDFNLENYFIENNGGIILN
ncbi:MAG: ATP-dependent DNA helicase RecG [Peptoniphilaceae bacterium]|nr:ATP-dependent DNA helicase RecG [Peptoniphilaceae bacterium]MDY3738187.1 ATP-dependent DNA helicase RecG [Peptoniphilaceae bacterium]